MPSNGKIIRSRQSASATRQSTVVWGDEVERSDFLKVPRALIRLGAYSSLAGKEIQPRHILLLLNFASRRFQDAPLVVEWKDVARDLGASADAVRHWAYELKKMKLLKIRGLFLGEGENSRRVRGVQIDMSGFVDLIAKSFELRSAERKSRLGHGNDAEMLDAAGKVRVSKKQPGVD